jgi:hypothetical protein
MRRERWRAKWIILGSTRSMENGVSVKLTIVVVAMIGPAILNVFLK